MTPDRLGPYRIEGDLGSGGSGTVVRAWDQRLERAVAIKQLRPRHAGSARARERLRREARAVASLNHPAIVQLYDIVVSADGDWMVMELVDGLTLEQLCAGAPLTVPQAVPIAHAVADGLAAAHAAGIVHRDVKTANVMVGRDGQVKILDFGVARQMAPDAEQALTADGAVLGTPHAMAPEQAVGNAVDHRADLFSLGSLIYELLTGTPPFRGDNWLDTLNRVCQLQLPALCEVVPAVPPELSRLVARLLEKDPALRPAHTGAVVDSLATLLTASGDQDQRLPRVLPEPMADPREPTLEAASRPAERGERRQLSVLSCDLVSPGGGTLDPETLFALTPAFHRLVAAVAQRFAGHLSEQLDHSAALYFGYPRAREDDARRALAAARALLGGAATLAADVAGRVGIHTGPAVTSPGSGQLVLGATAAIAATLRRHADAGGLLLSRRCHSLVAAGARCSASAVPALARLGERPEAFRWLGERRRGLGDERKATPLVGRRRTLAGLLRGWRRARRGEGRVFLLRGEAGIGKSRLTAALAQLLRPRASVLAAYGAADDENRPFGPVVDLLRRILARDRGRILAGLERMVRAGGRSPATGVPLLASLLSVPLAPPYQTPRLSPAGRRRQTLACLQAILLAATAERPLLLVVEDLHWVDPSTLELLHGLAANAPRAALLLVLTCRPSFQLPWDREPAIDSVEVTRLSRGQIIEVVAAVAAERRLPPAVIERIADKADGIPLFAEEVTKAVLEAEPADLSGSEDLDLLIVPATLQDSLMARLDRLGPARSVAQRAAVIGRSFDRRVLAAVSDLTAGDLDAELARLVDAGLLVAERGGQLAFCHALIRDAAYQSQLATERRAVHDAVARVLERRFPQQVREHPEVLARHLSAAGRPEPAVGCWRRAGSLAVARSANREAIGYFRQGLALIPALPPGEERDLRELAFHTGLGSALVALEGFAGAEVERAYARAAELCRALGDSPRRVSVLEGLRAFHLTRGELDDAERYAQDLLALAERSDNDVLRSQARHGIGAVAFFRGRLETAARAFEQVCAVAQPSGDFAPGHDYLVASMGFLADLRAFAGAPLRARQLAEQGLERARRIGHAFSESHALLLCIIVGYALGDRAWVELHAGSLLALAERQGFGYHRGPAELFQRWARVHRRIDAGDRRAARRQLPGMVECWRRFRATGARIPQTALLSMIVDAALHADDLATAVSALDHAAAAVHDTGEALLEAAFRCQRGELALRRGEREPARDAFASALACARRQGAHTFALRAALALARLAVEDGEADAGRAVLAPVLAGMPEPDGAWAEIRAARALIRSWH